MEDIHLDKLLISVIFFIFYRQNDASTVVVDIEISSATIVRIAIAASRVRATAVTTTMIVIIDEMAIVVPMTGVAAANVNTGGGMSFPRPR